MSRPLRLELPDGLYHVTSRGDRREQIFADDGDRACLLNVLAQGLERFEAVLHAYCLMGNHYHFVLQTRRSNLSRLMRHVNGVYSQAYNRRHGVVGHLFQGRFVAIHVDRDAYFLEVCRYVDLNPVRGGITDDPAGWNWSSYRAHVGIDLTPPWLDSAAIHGSLIGRDAETGADLRTAQTSYARLVHAGRGVRLWESSLRQSIYLGEAAFIERTQRRVSAAQLASRDIPSTQLRRPGAVDGIDCARRAREKSMLLAYVQEGRTLSSIAADWNLSISRVSRLISRAEKDAVHARRDNLI